MHGGSGAIKVLSKDSMTRGDEFVTRRSGCADRVRSADDVLIGDGERLRDIASCPRLGFVQRSNTQNAIKIELHVLACYAIHFGFAR